MQKDRVMDEPLMIEANIKQKGQVSVRDIQGQGASSERGTIPHRGWLSADDHEAKLQTESFVRSHSPHRGMIWHGPGRVEFLPNWRI
jgi:hypothetical protein